MEHKHLKIKSRTCQVTFNNNLKGNMQQIHGPNNMAMYQTNNN